MAVSAHAGYVLLDDFNGLAIGLVQGQGGWVDTGGSSKIAADPVTGTNKVLAVSGVNTSVYHALNALAIGPTGTGTVYFRLYWPGTTLYAYEGLSTSAAPAAGDTSDYETQLGSDTTNPGILKLRDAAAYDSVGTFKSNTWYQVWMVCDATKNLYNVYVNGGDFTTQTLLTGSDGETSFTFRNTSGDGFNSASAPQSRLLATFALKTRTSHVGPLYVDDVYVDSTGANLAVPNAAPDKTPPDLAGVVPPAGATVSNLTQVTVTFSEPVIGISALDLLLNDIAASSISGSGSTYTFSFAQPTPGSVQVRFDPGHTITDTAGNRFDEKAAGHSWSYTLLDASAPVVDQVTPAGNATVTRLSQIELLFSRPVTGVNAADLLVNGTAATNVIGSGLGPYVFSFAQPALGIVRFSWAANHGIKDMAATPHALAAVPWTNTLVSVTNTGSVVINEFLAANVSTNGLRDEDGELQSWIELYNPNSKTVNLAGWSLTDDQSNLGKWTFPATNLGAGKYMVVFASGKGRRSTGGGTALHTDFKLGINGDYLALCGPEFPQMPAVEFAPTYPEQRSDYSYGSVSSNQWNYFAVPTPGGANGASGITNVLGPVHFAVERGLYNTPFELILTAPVPGALIRYTRDGSLPTQSNGQDYAGPLTVDTTMTLRAAAFQSGSLPSTVKTHTYVFPAAVLSQPSAPAGFPISTAWSQYGYVSDYGVSQSVVNDPRYRGTLTNDLLAIPTMSIVMNVEDIFGVDRGIYTHLTEDQTYRGPDWERSCSIELLNPDGTPGFQCDAGLQMHGGGSRVRTMKHPMRVVFKSKFGPGKLNFRLFPDGPVEEFDCFDLRSDYNNHWTHGGDASQRARGTLVRDAWVKDCERAIGGLSSHSRYVHLYINGLYWGVYNPCEVPNGAFGASYLGGAKEDYDAYNGTGMQLVDGNDAAHNAMLAISGLQNLAQYDAMRQYLDVTQYADYMILQIFGANHDWGNAKNWYCLRKREPGAGFKYVAWDSERIFEAINDLPMGVSSVATLNSVSPDGLQAKLVASPEYRLLFADRVQKHFFNGGVLTSNSTVASWKARAGQLDRAIVAESARWGAMMTTAGQPGSSTLTPLPYPTYLAGAPYSRDDNWVGEINRLLTSYFPYRADIVLNQFRTVGLYPTNVMAPVFSQFGGRVAGGFALTLLSTNSIYYTTDGSDPRIRGSGAVSTTATLYRAGTPVTLLKTTLVKARSLQGTTNWSALVEATFNVNDLGSPLRISELMYAPVGGADYEFLELFNSGANAINLGGYSFEGITYVFPPGASISGGGRLILGNNGNPTKWGNRYPGVTVAGWYGGSLDNAGERIALLDRAGQIVCSVTYSPTNGWPTGANGGGYSVEFTNSNSDPNDPANWRLSKLPNGTPGQAAASAPAPTLVISEIMARNVSAVSNAGTTPDWVELLNVGNEPVNTAQWSLTDDAIERKFLLPETNLPPGGFLMIWCDAATNSTPGPHSGFKLNASGGDVFLFDPNTNRVDACGYGTQVADYSIGRCGGIWVLTVPTPGVQNVAAITASATNLVINEWMANPLPGDDNWIELYNRSTNAPVALQGLFLSSSNSLCAIRSLSFVGTNEFAVLIADKSPGPAHVNIKLPASGATNCIFDLDGKLIDQVVYGPQVEGASEGRLPDGSGNIVRFLRTASPGSPNYLPSYSGPVLNEVLASNRSITNADGATRDWVELYNPGTTEFNLEGFGIGTKDESGASWKFPSQAVVEGNGYLRIYFDNNALASTRFEPEMNTGKKLSAGGDVVYLFDAAGQVVDKVEFGPQAADLSIGVVNGQWRLLAKLTPGAPNAAPAALASPANLRINEWFAAPFASQYSFVELYNSAQAPVALGGLYLTDDLSISGMMRFEMPPLSFVAPRGFAVFKTDGHPSKGLEHVSFQLSDVGEALRLYDSNLNIVDSVYYGSQNVGVSGGRLPDGGDQIGILNRPTPGIANSGSTLVFTIRPASQMVAEGGSVQFWAEGEAFGRVAYQWYHDDTVVPGATNKVLTLTNTAAADSGVYRLVASDDYGSFTSDPVFLGVAKPLTFGEMASGPAGFGFNLHGAPGVQCLIEKATNLAEPNWSILEIRSFESNSMSIFDYKSTNGPSGFYRVRQIW